MKETISKRRHLGLLAATSVGVGAIVGGGILALAGVAFAATGPAAVVAFALNGAIAILTALTFAEMSSKFPESGGTYTFAKKVVSVEVAFTVGWVAWFASVVAAVLYALGLAHFTIIAIRDCCPLFSGEAPRWLAGHGLETALAVGLTLASAAVLMWRAGASNRLVNVAKVAVFGILILGGFWALSRQAPEVTMGALDPFFSKGSIGLFEAMGYSFIALQGFDLIAAVGGEVQEPEKNLPRAMIYSLLIALAIYLPLLFVIATVGVPAGQSIVELSNSSPEDVVTIAARNYLGEKGYWLVLVAAILAMYSALQANLFAASRIVRSMARDRTLHAGLTWYSVTRGTPVAAVAVTAFLVSLILLLIPNVAAAGAASSVIFLVTFALAHGIAILVRIRSRSQPPPFQSPLFPMVPVAGGLACIALAVFQSVVVPEAGLIALIWLLAGGLTFLMLFSRRARIKDALRTAFEPELVSLRGRTPLVLVPVANPRNAAAMVSIASALVPSEVGRVMMLSVAVASEKSTQDDDSSYIDKAKSMLPELVNASSSVGIRAEVLTTVAPDPMEEIVRVASLHRCESVLLGLSAISDNMDGSPQEELLGRIDADIVVLRASEGFNPARVKNILVPTAGRGGHEHLLVRLLGSLLRTKKRQVTFLRVMHSSASPDAVRRVRREMKELTEDELSLHCDVEVAQNDNPIEEVVRRAEEFDLVILGVQRLTKRTKLFGYFTRQIVQATTCPVIVISRRG